MIKFDFNERGTFTVWALALCLLLFALSGISIDLWRAYDARKNLNEIADSSARAGASEIDIFQRQYYGETVLDKNAAQNSANANINENAAINRVNVISRNISVDQVNDEVTVELQSNYSFLFLRMLPGGSDATITVRSSARPYEN